MQLKDTSGWWRTGTGQGQVGEQGEGQGHKGGGQGGQEIEFRVKSDAGGDNSVGCWLLPVEETKVFIRAVGKPLDVAKVRLYKSCTK